MTKRKKSKKAVIRKKKRNRTRKRVRFLATVMVLAFAVMLLRDKNTSNGDEKPVGKGLLYALESQIGLDRKADSRSDEYNSDSKVIIDVPIESQFPELYNGCEAVAVLMMLEKHGLDLDKVEFADQIPRDYTELVTDEETGEILVWGDPDVGFVGDMKGEVGIGSSINPAPLVEFLKSYVDNPVNLTGSGTDVLEKYIRNERPVVVWVTVDFQDPGEYKDWQTSDGKKIHYSFGEHAMTLVGFDEQNYYLNDPYTGTKNYSVSKERFNEIWTQMGRQALSVE